MWKPISLRDLNKLISKGEAELNSQQLSLWALIRIEPEKWIEPEYAAEGGGFWVVGIVGREIIWYNDIEEGFNVSCYTTYGHIDEYKCDQFELNHTIIQLMKR